MKVEMLHFVLQIHDYEPRGIEAQRLETEEGHRSGSEEVGSDSQGGQAGGDREPAGQRPGMCACEWSVFLSLYMCETCYMDMDRKFTPC